MSNLLLCVGRYAEKPYYLKKIFLNIWSVEELCYLFKTNPFMLDQDIVNRELADWLDTECGLTELSHKLYNLFNKANSTGLFIMTILEYVNYCTPAEQKQIADIMQGNVGVSDYEKKKKRADFLVENGRYLMAVREYDRILEEMPEGEAVISGGILHNMGVAYAKLFMFENAAENFLKAYELTGEEQSGQQYLAAVRQQMSEEDYIRFIADRQQFYNISLQVEHLAEQAGRQFEETEESRMLFVLGMYKEEGNVNSYYEEIDKVTADIKLRYRECVME